MIIPNQLGNNIDEQMQNLNKLRRPDEWAELVAIQ